MRFTQRKNRLVARYIKPKPAETYPEITLLSHHIPKTAGTSLRRSLEQAFGINSVYGAYNKSVMFDLSNGEKIWVPNNTRVIHGHFKPHTNHETHFPNMFRMVWLRDPAQRALSQLKHALVDKQPVKASTYLQSTYLTDTNINLDDLFLSVLKDKHLQSVFNVYHQYFNKERNVTYDFIGRAEDFEKEIVRLSQALNIELNTVETNRSKYQSNKDVSQSALEVARKLLQPEYDIYNEIVNSN